MGEQKSLATVAQRSERIVTVTYEDVRKYLCPKASDPEICLFLKVCQSEGLNPFAREVYLVKYARDEPAAIIIAIDAFLKAAESCDDYDGHKAGIILKGEGDQPEFREGTFMLDDEKDRLMGGWAKVYRKDRDKPFYTAVNISEYRKFTRKGEPTRFWKEMPATMIRNVALRHALKEAFPSRFAGLYTTAEFEPVPEKELPPAYEKGGESNWRKFWARQKEKGLQPEDVHNILGVSSLKDEWLDKGQTLEEAEDIINHTLEQANKPKRIVKRDPTTITTINELFKACYEDFSMQPQQVYAELNVHSVSEITELPSDCYSRIAAVRQEPE